MAVTFSRVGQRAINHADVRSTSMDVAPATFCENVVKSFKLKEGAGRNISCISKNGDLLDLFPLSFSFASPVRTTSYPLYEQQRCYRAILYRRLNLVKLTTRNISTFVPILPVRGSEALVIFAFSTQLRRKRTVIRTRREKCLSKVVDFSIERFQSDR